VMNTGHAVLCETALEDAWLNGYPAAASR
jgi:hypothetical protein